MCPLERDRENKNTRGFPSLMNGVCAMTEAGYNFVCHYTGEKKKNNNNNKRIKSCIKYISMECLLFTFSIFEICKRTKKAKL